MACIPWVVYGSNDYDSGYISVQVNTTSRLNDASLKLIDDIQADYKDETTNVVLYGLWLAATRDDTVDDYTSNGFFDDLVERGLVGYNKDMVMEIHKERANWVDYNGAEWLKFNKEHRTVNLVFTIGIMYC